MRKVLCTALLVLFTALFVSCSAEPSEEPAPVGTVSIPEPLAIANDYYLEEVSEEYSADMQIEEEFDADEYADTEISDAEEESEAAATSVLAFEATDIGVSLEYSNWSTIDFASMGMSDVEEPEGMELAYLYGTNGSFIDWNASFCDVSEKDFMNFSEKMYGAGVKYSDQSWSEDGQSFEMQPAACFTDMITYFDSGEAVFYGFSWNGVVGTFRALWDDESETMDLAIWYVP